MSITTLFTGVVSPRYTLPLKNLSLSPPIPSSHVLNSHCKPYNSLVFTAPRPRILPFTIACKAEAYQGDHPAQTQTQNRLDAFLSIAELLCIVSPAIYAIGFSLYCTFLSSTRTALGVIGSSKPFAWALAMMSGGVAIGSWIRRRQWRRICVENRGRAERVNLVERIERLEEDIRSSATIVRALSRQLEKLGIRFRVTRKALKDPIAETAALAQRNSEATRALAIQEDILEKELGEIQKVLLAMQEQQQKQLELILAIGKTGKLWDSEGEQDQEQDPVQISDLNEDAKQFEMESHGTRPSKVSMGSNNERV